MITSVENPSHNHMKKYLRGALIFSVAAVIIAGLVIAGTGADAAKKMAGRVKAAVARKTATRCLNAEVTMLQLKPKAKGKAQEARLVVKYERGKAKAKKIVTQQFALSKKQYDVAVNRKVKRGSAVKACTTATAWNAKKTLNLTGNIVNRAPKGLEETFGNVDGSGGPGGGGGGSPETGEGDRGS